jgi:hypothetical protein
MAEHPNADLIRKGYDAFVAGDIEWMNEHLHDTIVWHEPGNNFLSGTFNGREKVLAHFATRTRSRAGSSTPSTWMRKGRPSSPGSSTRTRPPSTGSSRASASPSRPPGSCSLLDYPPRRRVAVAQPPHDLLTRARDPKYCEGGTALARSNE